LLEGNPAATDFISLLLNIPNPISIVGYYMIYYEKMLRKMHPRAVRVDLASAVQKMHTAFNSLATAI